MAGVPGSTYLSTSFDLRFQTLERDIQDTRDQVRDLYNKIRLVCDEMYSDYEEVRGAQDVREEAQDVYDEMRDVRDEMRDVRDEMYDACDEMYDACYEIYDARDEIRDVHGVVRDVGNTEQDVRDEVRSRQATSETFCGGAPLENSISPVTSYGENREGPRGSRSFVAPMPLPLQHFGRGVEDAIAAANHFHSPHTTAGNNIFGNPRPVDISSSNDRQLQAVERSMQEAIQASERRMQEAIQGSERRMRDALKAAKRKSRNMHETIQREIQALREELWPGCGYSDAYLRHRAEELGKYKERMSWGSRE